MLAQHLDPKPDLFFFHTQTTSLFCCDWMKRVPAVISLDATPKNLERLGLSHFNHRKESRRLFAQAARRLNRTTKSALNQRAYRSATAIVAWSHWVKDSLVDDYGIAPDKVHVIPPGVEVEDWKCPQKQAGETRLKLLFVGGDFSRKGGNVLVEAWRTELRNRCDLHVVTNAEVNPEPGLFVHRNLKANSRELRRLFSDADIFVLPTFADTFGIVLAEASASSLPIVATRVGGISDIVIDGETGLLCDPGDVSGLVKAVTTLVENPDLRIKMGAKACDRAERFFDSDTNSARLLEVFSRCIT